MGFRYLFGPVSAELAGQWLPGDGRAVPFDVPALGDASWEAFAASLSPDRPRKGPDPSFSSPRSLSPAGSEPRGNASSTDH
jgi:hypothetical protein